MLPLTLLLLTAAPDAPTRVPTSVVLAQTRTEDARAPLERARKLAEELRYEEAAVEYQRYLGLEGRPAAERAQALLELGYIHLLLEDETNAELRTAEALEQDAWIRAPANAPPQQVELLERVRAQLAARPKLAVLPREGNIEPRRVRASLKDPQGKTSEVLLRHATAPDGPYRAARMACEGDTCEGELPTPGNTTDFTAWYFVEALDAQGNTLARAATPRAPLQLSVIEQRAWYESPWVYAGGAAVLVGAAAVFFVASDPG
ncbi:hypothetical protein [Hyalangium rubrum]|uniref:Tetratricopeptide repeat protein n=1 Tax=Hyalangium rubrum TaxID=3103134 RepID=A0ABU5H4M5_9BACT|nr:hypothetical protein [Hyalangium sp. s54d21]MDY7227834.1 hypothetical protein [Hyalangium sp. s54d21]